MNSKINIRFLSIKSLIKLFDSLICPILLYGSEDKWDQNPIERVHTQFMKRILGLNRATSNTLVRGDMGRYSLQSKAISINIKYLNQIKQVKQAYLVEGNQTQNRISTESSAKKVNTNLKNLFNKEIDEYKLSNYKLKQYIDTIFCESWKNK